MSIDLRIIPSKVVGLRIIGNNPSVQKPKYQPVFFHEYIKKYVNKAIVETEHDAKKTLNYQLVFDVLKKEYFSLLDEKSEKSKTETPIMMNCLGLLESLLVKKQSS